MSKVKKILFINASPRKGGNTDIVLSKISNSIGKRAQSETIIINDLNFRPCQGCEECAEGAVCILDDDLGGIYKKIADSDVIIFGSPIYFGSLSSQAKMLIDRMQPFWVAKQKRLEEPSLTKEATLNIKRKKGFLVLVSGSSREYFFENAKQIIKNFFDVVNTQYCGQLFYAKIDKKGEILDFPGIEKQAKDIAEAALEL
ncbi:MAG: flavodoxin family protein [Candidatus Omnitrophica bacterium]|nr:flavodoxin family protein [Candidatus Omnitrophota bacterium]